MDRAVMRSPSSSTPTKIGDVYKNPVVAIEKLQQAHQDLAEALDIADRLKTKGIETARQNIGKLSELTVEIEQKTSGSKPDHGALEA